MGKRPGVTIKTKVYQSFKGVDFTTDPSLVDDSRSPYALNIIADMGGMPEKRPGYRMVQEFDQTIYGLYNCEFNDVKHLLAHSGSNLIRWYEDDTNPSVLYQNMPLAKSQAVYMNGKLWIFTGVKLLVYDGTSVSKAEDDAYIPLTVIASAPEGGGNPYEGINYLSSKQRVGFLADGESTEYHLPYDGIDNVYEVTINGTTTTNYSVDKVSGVVTFTEAPPAPLVGGEDNVIITFGKTFTGYADRINKCTNAIVWGIGGASDRIVACGNPDFKNQDYICDYMNGFYWSDTNYAIVGTSETAIMGYLRLGSYLAIVKEDNGQDSTIFLRSGEINDDMVYFSVKPTISGTGAVSRFGFGNIDDEQMFLTGNGVYALTNNSLTAERIVQNRSFRIDPKLINEDLTSAMLINFRSYLMIFVGGKVYGLDGMQPKAYTGNNENAYSYECFYWEHIPACCIMKSVSEGIEQLYFGSTDGCIYKFNYDINNLTKYSDDGEAIEAILSTKSDDDGDPMVLKTLIKKGNAVTIKPYSKSSAEIMVRTEKDASAWLANSGRLDISDWENFDFERITFETNDAPREIVINRKVKKYKRLQIVIRNNEVNEGFGVYGIVKHYVTGNYAKR